MIILISESAHENINSIVEFTSNISTSYANRIVNAIYSSINSLEFSPYSGRYVPEIMNNHFREVLCSGYRIMYFISEKENLISVRYILNNRQNRTHFLEIHKNEIIDILNFLIR